MSKEPIHEPPISASIRKTLQIAKIPTSALNILHQGSGDFSDSALGDCAIVTSTTSGYRPRSRQFFKIIWRGDPSHPDSGEILAQSNNRERSPLFIEALTQIWAALPHDSFLSKLHSSPALLRDFCKTLALVDHAKWTSCLVNPIFEPILTERDLEIAIKMLNHNSEPGSYEYGNKYSSILNSTKKKCNLALQPWIEVLSLPSLTFTKEKSLVRIVFWNMPASGTRYSPGWGSGNCVSLWRVEVTIKFNDVNATWEIAVLKRSPIWDVATENKLQDLKLMNDAPANPLPLGFLCIKSVVDAIYRKEKNITMEAVAQLAQPLCQDIWDQFMSRGGYDPDMITLFSKCIPIPSTHLRADKNPSERSLFRPERAKETTIPGCLDLSPGHSAHYFSDPSEKPGRIIFTQSKKICQVCDEILAEISLHFPVSSLKGITCESMYISSKPLFILGEAHANLTELDLSHVTTFDDWMFLHKFPQLELLYLGQSNFESKYLDILTELKNLRGLDLTGTRLDNESMKRVLPKLTGLESLTICHCAGLNLKTEDATIVAIADALGAAKKLHSLRLSAAGLTQSGVGALKQLVPVLTSLEIVNIFKSIPTLGDITSLTRLAISSSSRVMLKDFGKMKDLVYLHVGQGSGLTSEDLPFVKDMPKLEYLEMPWNKVARVDALHGNKSLRLLDLSGCNLYSVNIAKTALKMPALRSLRIKSSSCKLKNFRKLNNLTELDLSSLGGDRQGHF